MGPGRDRIGRESDVKRDVAGGLQRVGLGSTIARNSVFLLAGEAVARVVNLVISIALFRYLQPAGMGDFNFIVKYGVLFGVIAEFGLTRAAVLEVARLRAGGMTETEALSATLGRTALLRAITGGVCLLLVGVSLLIPPGWTLTPETKGLILLWTCSLIFQAFRRNAEIAFQASQKLHFHALFIVGARLLAAAAVTVAILTGRGLVSVVVAYVIADFLDALLSNLFAARKVARPRMPADVRSLLPLALVGVPFALQLFANQVYYYIDTPMLKYLFPGTEERVSREIGYYACAYQVVLTLTFVPISLVNAIFPAVSNAWHAGDRDRVRSLTSYSLKLLLLTGPALAVGFYLFRTEFITIVFRSRFLPAVPMLAVVVWTIPLAFANGAVGGLLAATGAQRVVAASAFANAFFNFGLNWLLIPTLGGLGTSITTTATEAFCLVTMLGAVFVARRGLMGGRALVPLVGFQTVALAGLIGGLGSGPLAWRMAAYAVYAAICAAWLARTVQQRRHKP